MAGLLDILPKKPGLLANVPDYTGTLGDLGSIGMPSFTTKTSTQAVPDATTGSTVGALRDLAQAFPRDAATIGISVANAVNPGTVGGTIDPSKMGPLGTTILGKEPIGGLAPTAASYEKKLGGPGLFSTPLAVIGATAPIGLDFLGVGGEANALKTAVKIGTEGDAMSFLMKAGVTEDLARQFAPDVVKVTTTKDAKALFTSIENLQKTTKAVGPDVGYAVGDRVATVDKATGKPGWGGVVKSVDGNNVMIVNEKSGIPAKTSLDKWDVNLVDKNVPFPKSGPTFGELAAMEKAGVKTEAEARAWRETQAVKDTLATDTQPNTYHVLAHPGKVGGNEPIHIPVAGKPVNLGVPGVAQEFFVHRPVVNGKPSEKGWVVSERSTGMSIYSGDSSTQKAAIEKARGIIEKAGPEGTTKAVSTQVERYGKTPTATPTHVPTEPVVQGAVVDRPTLNTTPDQLPSGVPQATTAIAEPSLAEVKQISEDIATPFKQVVGIGAQTTKEPGLFKRVTTKLGEAFRSTVEYVQDAETRVQKLLQQPGMKVTEATDPYLKMTAYPGRVASKIDDVRTGMESMANDIVDVADRTGIDTSVIKRDVNEYLQATHAPERNAALGDGAAGMTNAEAESALARVDALPHSAEIKRIAEQARKMNEQGLVLLKDSGVISNELFTTLTEKYPNHVPLQRIFEGDEIQSALSVRGFDVKSTGIKRAKGSELEVADIMSNIQHNYEQAVIRSEKNIVDQATLAFVRDNREALKGLMEVRKPKAIGTDFSGKILMERTTDPSYLQLYEKGKPVWIKVTDPALALAFKGIGREKLPTLLRGVGAFTRFYAGLATRFNPEFAFPNKIRVLQETMIYMAAQPDVGFKGAAKMVAGDPASTKAVWDSIRGVDSSGARMYAEMKSLGGTTGGFGLSTRKQVELDLENMISTAKSRPKQAAQDVLQYIDNWNTVFEDSTRLSVYKQALSQGLSKERAAFLAKEASINFNRMGRGGPVINAIWMFSNASIQGSAKMLRALRNPKVAVTVITAVGASTAAVNEWNDKVDPQWRDKVTKWDRLNGLPIVLPPGKDGGTHYVVIPVSWGIKPIKVMADFAYDSASGMKVDLAKVSSDLFSATADAYNPLGGTDPVSALTPTVLDVPVEIVRNQQWSGSKIRPDFDKNAPKDVQYFSTLGETATGKLFIDLTKKLQESTGVAISPADMNYAFNQYIGGAGKAAMKTANTILGVTEGKNVPADEYPFVSRFYRTRTQEEVGQGAGGDTSVLQSVLQNQSRERFYATQGAEDAYTKMKAMPPDQARTTWEALNKTDPTTAAKVADIAKQDKKGLTYTERLITQLGVADGARALFLKGKFDELKSNTDKGTLWQNYVDKGIITPQVADQITYLLKNPQVGKKGTP